MVSPEQLLRLLKIDLPIVQAPMAGVSTPAMAAAVSNAGALGSIGIGSVNAASAAKLMETLRERTRRSFNVNVFCNTPPKADAAVEAAWLERLRPEFNRLGASPPARLKAPYKSFLEDDEMLALFLQTKPAVVSFHFGLPQAEKIRALREAGIVLMASATSPREARLVAQAGIDCVIAQGYEAGGHRGCFDPDADDDRLGTLALTRLLATQLDIPVIAAGGIMDGAGVAAALRLGASAAQLGTAFICCEESDADAHFRAALASDSANHTMMTRAISGRPARGLPTRFAEIGRGVSDRDIPAYPIAYDAAKALNAAAKLVGNKGYGVHLAGQGAPLARSLPAGALVAKLAEEITATQAI